MKTLTKETLLKDFCLFVYIPCQFMILSEHTRFQEGVGVQESKHEVLNSAPFYSIAENRPSAPIFLNL